MKTTSRLIAACLPALMIAGTASAEDDVRLRLNWMYYGSHAPFSLGLDAGYYDEQDIDLDIRSGNGSSAAARLVANGDSDFAYGSCAATVTLAAQGAPLISVGVIDAMGTEAVIVRPDTGIETIADLEGQKILTTANAGVNTFFPLVLANAGLSEDDVTIVNVPEGALISGYIQGPDDSVGILGGLDDKPSQIKTAGGPEPVTFPYSDYGVNQVGYCVVAHKDMVEENPELVKRFMAATVKAFSDAEADPMKAIDAMADIVGGSANTDESKAAELDVLNVTLGVLYSAGNTDKKIGYHVASDWEDMLTLMKDYNDLETDMVASDFYTNDFLPE